MTRIKICGLYRPEDIRYVNEARPDWCGFILHFPKSHRNVTPDQARALRAELAPGIVPVGVFVDQPAEVPAALLRDGTISVAQLHGHEDDAYLAALRELAPGCVIWKTFQVRSAADLRAVHASAADLVLLDNGCGTGETFDWSLAGGVTRPFLLAGGADPGKHTGGCRRPPPLWAGPVQRGGDREEKGSAQDRGGSGRCAEGVSVMSRGRFGIHGGQYIPETLMNAVMELEEAYDRCKDDPAFNRELTELFNEYAGRPSRLYFARRMTEDLGGAKVYLKREDLNHTGAHKINNVLGQALLAQRMGKTRLIAETGAGQHGVATATAAALMGMECVVFMGEEDTRRQALNVYKMRLLGARVVPVTTGTATLKDAVSEAMREWTGRIRDTHYCLGSVMGPHPFPTIVRDFQAVISREIREQLREKEGKLPDAVVACVGGGSNAIGAFYHFIGEPSVRLIGCEAAGRGVDTPETAATIATGRLGIFHGMKSYFCQDQYGQIAPVYSTSAGLDYPGIGPEHAWLHDTGRAEYVPVTDSEAVDAFEYLSRLEGIIPAIESAHAVAYARKLAPTMGKEQILVVTISGRGDKDCVSVARYRGEEISE